MSSVNENAYEGPRHVTPTGYVEDREAWKTQFEKACVHYRFAVIWSVAWILATLIALVGFQVIIIPFFTSIAFLSGLAGLVTDGRKMRGLKKIGRDNHWL